MPLSENHKKNVIFVMNRYIIIIVVSLLALSCGNGKGKKEEATCGGPGIGIDTETVHKIERYEDSLRAAESLNDASKSVLPSSSSKLDYDEPDNMRGFDPASEDDMDDNGMSRYMENNDDEGWD